jgi:Double-GTPase 2
MTDEAVPRCKKQDCQVSVTRKCAEGHDPVRSCPNFIGAVESAEEEGEFESEERSDGGNAEAEKPLLIQLSAGDLLSIAEVERFLLWRPATFVSVVGDSNSGKTTLMCAVYDRFLRGPFAGVSFAASRTLVALERRIYPSRVESGRLVPDSPRTSIADGLRYFHFAVAPVGSPRARVDFMLSDRAGETYRLARSHSERVADLPEISQADTVVLLLDGGRVADAVERAGAIHGTRQMLRVLLDNGALGSTSVVQVVTTKIDIIARREDSQAAMETIAAFRERAAADFGPRLGKLSFREIAARDPDGTFDPAHGIDALVQDWIIPRVPVSRVPPARPELNSEFDRLLSRTPADEES